MFCFYTYVFINMLLFLLDFKCYSYPSNELKYEMACMY